MARVPGLYRPGNVWWCGSSLRRPQKVDERRTKRRRALIAVKRIMVSLLLAAMISASSLEAQEPKETVVGKGAEAGRTWTLSIFTPCPPGCRLLYEIDRSGQGLVGDAEYFYGGTDGRTIRLERTKSTFVVDKFEKKSLSILLPLEADSTATLVIEPHWNFAKPVVLRLKKNPDHSLSGAVAK
jgi:hypothetical protein